MITYNWVKVFKYSQGRPRDILDIMRYLTNSPIPRNDYDPIIKFTRVDWTGSSFLVNPEEIQKNRGIVSEKELAEYVALASFRSLAEYQVTGRKTLPIQHLPVAMELINNNKLLSAIDNEVFFCWEETKQ